MAKVLQNLYYIYKIPSNKISQLKEYSFKEAYRDGNVVSIGDNSVLRKLREYYGDTRSHIDLYNKVQNIREEMKNIKKDNSSNSNSLRLKALKDELNNMLYVKDIINIKVMAKKEYAKLARNGFDLNGKHFVRFMVGSGQMRRNTVTFINEELKDYMQEHLMCGLNNKIKNINLAKLSAYFALSFSSVLWVREPRVCVIKDFYTVAKNEKINFIHSNGKETVIDQITKDIKQNSMDGQGLISPEMAALWAEDMHLSYTPSSFVVRAAFIKGNLVPFDFKQYARENGITTIEDRYGTIYNIEDIDVLLSESQFKMAKYYSSWETYLSCHHQYNLQWGVARYNKEFDEEYVLTNYQYLQVLDLSDEDIKGVLEYTLNWIKKICSGDKLYSMLYNVGVKNNDDIDKAINSCGSTFTKAMVKNNDLLQDGFIQRKIYNSIKESIRQAKLGRIWVKGNYEFMISDPVAQCRNALGLSPDGLLKYGEIYSQFWNKRTDSKEISLMRSPLTHYSEANIEKIARNDEMDKWYKHIYSGIIYNIYDISVAKHADSDFDGDIVFSTDNKFFLKGTRRNEVPILYDKEMIPTQKITLPNQIRCDLKGLDTKVGQITNYSTSMMAMLPLFKKEQQLPQKKEIEKRLKMCRKLQGEEIDKIKGTTPPQFPKEWRYYLKINLDDTDIEKAEKYRYNSMVVKKKPYFFIYLYSGLMQDYKNYTQMFNRISLKQFGSPIKMLVKKQNKNEAEMNLVRKYQKNSPVLETNCLMNNLCKTVENTEFDIKYKNNKNSSLKEFSDFSNINKELVEDLKKIYKEYKSQKRVRGITTIVNNEGLQDDDIKDMIQNLLYANRDECKDKMYELISNSKDLFNHLVYMCEENNYPYDFIWDILNEDIIEIIPKRNNTLVRESEFGEEYLGKKYILEEV